VGGAVDAFRQALVLAPDDAGLTLGLGHALLGEGKVDRSQEAFRQGLRKGDLELSLAWVYAGSVAWPSAFLGLMFLAVTLLFSTLGTLLRGRLDHAGSLRSTLRGLAGAGTLPFLLFFVYVEQDLLLEPLRHGEMISRKALDRLFGYLLVWGVGLWFAMLLSRILSRSILEPIDSSLRGPPGCRAPDGQRRQRHDRARGPRHGALQRRARLHGDG
jgi:hypothetical protein